MDNGKELRLTDSQVRHLINVLNAKTRIYLFIADNEIFNGYVYQLYDNMKLIEELYISDMVIDYDSIRVMCYNKWN